MVHAPNFTTVQDNTAPDLYITIQRNGNTVDLTGCTVDLLLFLDETQKNTGHTSCTLEDAENGVIKYQPQSGDFDTAGTYLADIKITYGDSSVEICTEQATITVRQKLS